MSSLIQFQNIHKQFPGATEPAVQNCTLEVPPGSFVVILGHSGCGKTTLLKMVNRIYEPTSGAIFIDEENILELDPNLLRRRIGYVIQQVGLFPHMKVAENVAVVPRLLQWEEEKIRERVEELLNLVELSPEEYGDRYPSQLSGGQQQRVGLARALAADPGIMLMDEPFGAIDAITRKGLQEEMMRLQSRLGKTILFVTHDVDEAMRLADRIIIMNQGGVEQYDTPLNILLQPASEFVRHLTGSDDVLRRLSLVTARQAMESCSEKSSSKKSPSISPGTDLRQALSAILDSDGEALSVREDGRTIGSLSMKNIRAVLKGDKT